MKLLFKFNLIFVFAFGVGLAVAAFVSHRIVQSNAREQVLQQARLMMETAMATRSYTSTQVAPLLKSQRYQLQAVLDQFSKSVDSGPPATLPLDAAGLTDQTKDRHPESVSGCAYRRARQGGGRDERAAEG